MRFILVLLSSLICRLGFAESPQILNFLLNGYTSGFSLKIEIQALVAEDQDARARIVDFTKISEEEKMSLNNLRLAHNPKLKKIISTYGWPRISLIGSEAAQGMWLLVQHQDQDLTFQKECLALLKTAVEEQEAGGREYAYLLDRVRKNENLPQVYGTQWIEKEGQLILYPVENSDQLNQLRLEVGLNTIEEYQEEMKKLYHLE